MKILITGGAGFIGAEITEQLARNDTDRILVLDNLSTQIHGENPEESFLLKKIRGKCDFVKGDIRDYELIKNLIQECDCVIHLAAETGTGQSMYKINHYNEVNLMGTSNIFQALADSQHRPKKIILASSRAVYGEGKYKCLKHGIIYPEARKREDMVKGDFLMHCPICGDVLEVLPTDEESKISPSSLYAFTKYSQEKMIETMCRAFNIDYTIFRLQNVYGIGQSLSNPYTGILSIFSELMLQNKDINIFEDGQESRDFINVTDVARAFIMSINRKETNSKVINLGSGQRTSVIEVAEILKKNYRSSSRLKISGNFRIGDIAHNFADMSNAEKLLGFHASISLSKGIKEFTKWVQSQGLEKMKYKESIEEMKRAGLFIS